MSSEPQSDIEKVRTDIEKWVSDDLPKSPYPGLRPFEMEEWKIFFGRESITDEVIERLIKQHMVSVHGSSGSGKSSLLRAGVMPRLKQDLAASGLTLRSCTMVPGNAPLRYLAEALASLDGEVSRERALDRKASAERILNIRRRLNRGAKAGVAIAEMLRRGSADHICILVDQFEELFAFAKTNRDEALLFAEILVGLAEAPVGGVYAMLTMRSDYLGECARFPGLAEAINQTQYLLPRMNHASLVRAIRDPADLYGGQVSLQLAEQIIADASSEQDELPLMQHGLMLLWRDAERARSSGGKLELSLADYLKHEGLGAMLSAHADRIMMTAAPDGARRNVVEHLFRALTDTNADRNGIRRRQRFSDLCKVTGLSAERLYDVIAFFRAEGVSFLRPYGTDPIQPGEEVDISHEALIRCWQKIANRKDGWLQREFRDGLIWRSLLVAADSFDSNPANVLAPTATDDRDKWLKDHNEAWSRRYGGGWDRVQRLMAASREDRDRRRKEREAANRAVLDAQAARAEAAEREAEARAARIEVAEHRANEQAALAKASRNRALVVVTLFAFVALGAVVFAFTQSIATDRANEKADSANEKLATTLWSQLEFKEQSLLPNEVKALWDLTLAKPEVHKAFWLGLPSNIRKLGGGAEYLTRTTGLLKSERSDASLTALSTLLKESPNNMDQPNLYALVTALHSLPVALTSAQNSDALDGILRGLTTSTDSEQLKGFVGLLQAFVPQLTSDQIQTARSRIVESLRAGIDFNQLWARVSATRILSVKLTPEQSQVTLDNILANLRSNTNLAQLTVLANTLLELVPQLTPEQFRSTVDRFLDSLTTAPNSAQSRLLVAQFPIVFERLSAEQVSVAFNYILANIRTRTSTLQVSALATALDRLVPRLPPDQVSNGVEGILERLGATAALPQIRPLAKSLATLYATLPAESRERTVSDLLKIISTDLTTLQTRELVSALRMLVDQLAPEAQETTVNGLLVAISSSTNNSRNWVLISALQGLAKQLPREMKERTVNTILGVVNTSSNSSLKLDLANALLDVAPQLSLDQVQTVFDILSLSFSTATDADDLEKSANAFRLLIPKLTPVQMQLAQGQIVDTIFLGILGSSHVDDLTTFLRIFKPLIPQLSPAERQEALDRIFQGLRTSDHPDQLGTLGKAFQPLIPELASNQIQAAFMIVIQRLRDTVDANRQVALFNVFESLFSRLTPEQIQSALDLIRDISHNSNDSDQLRMSAKILELLVPRLTSPQIRAALDFILETSRANDSEQVKISARFLELLVPRLTPLQVQPVLDAALEGFRSSMDPEHLSALVSTLEAIVPKLGSEQLQTVRDRVAERVRTSFKAGSTNVSQLPPLMSAVGVLSLGFTPEELRIAQEVLLKTIRTDMKPFSQSELVRALQTLLPLLQDDQFDAVITGFSEAITSSTGQTRLFAGQFSVLFAKLTPEQVLLAFNHVLDDLRATLSPPAPTVSLFQALVGKISVEQVPIAIGRILESRASASTMGMFFEAMNAAPQTQLALATILDGFLTNTAPNQLSIRDTAVSVLVQSLNPDQVATTLEKILLGLDTKTNPDYVSALFISLEALARRLTPAQIAVALVPVFDRLQLSRSNDQITAIVRALEALAPIALAGEITEEQAQRPLAVLLAGLSKTTRTSFQAPVLVELLRGFVPKLTGEQIATLGTIARERLKLGGTPEERSGWAQLLNTQLRRQQETEHVVDVIEVLKFPTAAGGPTDVVLSGLSRISPFQGPADLPGMTTWVKRYCTQIKETELSEPPSDPSADKKPKEVVRPGPCSGSRK